MNDSLTFSKSDSVNLRRTRCLWLLLQFLNNDPRIETTCSMCWSSPPDFLQRRWKKNDMCQHDQMYWEWVAKHPGIDEMRPLCVKKKKLTKIKKKTAKDTKPTCSFLVFSWRAGKPCVDPEYPRICYNCLFPRVHSWRNSGLSKRDLETLSFPAASNSSAEDLHPEIKENVSEVQEEILW